DVVDLFDPQHARARLVFAYLVTTAKAGMLQSGDHEARSSRCSCCDRLSFRSLHADRVQLQPLATVRELEEPTDHDLPSPELRTARPPSWRGSRRNSRPPSADPAVAEWRGGGAPTRADPARADPWNAGACDDQRGALLRLPDPRADERDRSEDAPGDPR